MSNIIVPVAGGWDSAITWLTVAGVVKSRREIRKVIPLFVPEPERKAEQMAMFAAD